MVGVASDSEDFVILDVSENAALNIARSAGDFFSLHRLSFPSYRSKVRWRRLDDALSAAFHPDPKIVVAVSYPWGVPNLFFIVLLRF
jgi:hypothetical protein